MIHLSRLTFSITPDEALVETRQKLVIRENFGSIFEKIKTFLVYIDKINRMRNLHDSIGREFGLENVAILRKWEQLEKKIANFTNHRRFTLRCLSQRITPTSLKLRSNVKSFKGKRILERAERQLANEWVRIINNTIATCTCSRDTCMKELQDQISNFYFQECSRFIERVKESRHQTVQKRQMSKFDWLWQRNRGIRPQEHAENGHSKARLDKNREVPPNSTVNTKDFTKRWVKNLSSTPLTEAQFSLLAHGPNFMIAPRHPPWGLHHCN